MNETAFKKTTLVGESAKDIEDAVRTALATSASRVRGQSWCEIKDIRASIDENGAVQQWQVEVQVAFRVD